jgi:hypothetical protein
VAWAQWRDNLTRAQVVAALGWPNSTVQMGTREFLQYGGGVRIELRDGIVTDIEGPVPAALRAGAAAPSAAPVAVTSGANTVAPAGVAAGTVTTGNVPAAAPVVPTASTATVTVTEGTGGAGSPAPVAAPTLLPVAPTPVATAPVAPVTTAPVPGTTGHAVAVVMAPTTVVAGGGTSGGVTPTKVLPSAVASAAAAKPGTSTGSGGAGAAKEDADTAMVDEAANPTLPPEAAQLLQAAGMNGTVDVPGMGKVTMGPPPPKQNPWVAFAIGLGTSTLFMSVVLKVAFMRKDFPVIWRDVVWVSFVTALLYQGMYSLLSGNTYYDIIHMLQGDWMVVGALLLWMIVTFTEAKNFATAAKITVAAVSTAAVLQIAVAAALF